MPDKLRKTSLQKKTLESRDYQSLPWMGALADHLKSTVEACIQMRLRVLHDHVAVVRS